MMGGLPIFIAVIFTFRCSPPSTVKWLAGGAASTGYQINQSSLLSNQSIKFIVHTEL